MDQDELKSIVQDILELDLNNDWEVIDVSACSIYKNIFRTLIYRFDKEGPRNRPRLRNGVTAWSKMVINRSRDGKMKNA